MAKRFYWLKLMETFFNDDPMDWLLQQENGSEYCLFYLKLCLHSLKSNGVIIRKIGDMLIPYDIAKIMDVTKTDEETTTQALEILKKIGVIQVLDSGALYMTQIENMTGSETDAAARKRKEREKEKETTSRQKCDNVTTESRQRHIELEKEKELDIDLEKDKDFMDFWSSYPKQIGQSEAYNEWQKVLRNGIDKYKLIQSAKNYSLDVQDYPQKFIKHPKNFLANTTFVDYLPQNYKPIPANVLPACKPKNAFNDFPQRNYSKQEIDSLESRLIQK